MHQQLYDMAAGFVEHIVDAYLAPHLDKIDSPIERLFLEALMMNHFMGGVGFPHINDTINHSANPVFGVKTQYKIGRYRPDFMLISWDGRCLLVECDGHDFHERTKEQAARDRKKDRTLQAEGYIILRYTGSELWEDPMQCAADAARTLFKAKKFVVDRPIAFDLPLWMQYGGKYQEEFEKRLKEQDEVKKDLSRALGVKSA